MELGYGVAGSAGTSSVFAAYTGFRRSAETSRNHGIRFNRCFLSLLHSDDKDKSIDEYRHESTEK